MLQLDTSVQYVKGVGPKLAEVLLTKGISTVEDLLYYLPFRYEDRLNPRRIGELRPGEMASIIAEVRTSMLFRTRRAPLFELTVGDPVRPEPSPERAVAVGPGPAQKRIFAAAARATMKCIWFHGAYLKDRFQPGQLVAFYGKVEQNQYGRGGLQLINPQFEILDGYSSAGVSPATTSSNSSVAGETPALPASLEIGRIVPVYESAGSGKVTSRWFRRVIHGALENLTPDIIDAVPAAIRRRLALMPRRDAFWQAHWPPEDARLPDLQVARTPAQIRLIFEELFFLELGLELKRRRLRALPGIVVQIDDRVRAAVKRILPFHPTAAQKKVMKEIADDMRAPVPMRRLLQGDVGSGKTIVALEAAIIAIENGYQASLMAPTEILATQHFLSARRILEPAGYRVVLLTGSLDSQQKRDTRRHIADGNAQLVIGTHALIEEKVEFANLGLVIVDEQHRFGVMQRLKLMKKALAADDADDRTAADRSASGRSAGVSPATPPSVPAQPSKSVILSEDARQNQSAPVLRARIRAAESKDLGVPQAASESKAPYTKREPTGRDAESRRESPEPQPDVLVMTATPIPRTLALTLYGDLDVSVLDELPPGRSPIITRRVPDERADEVFAFVRKQVAAGHQAYVVYPVIEESEEKELKAAVKMYDEIRRRVLPDLRIGLLHGRLPADDKEEIMRRFQRREIDVLVSTTVIEVGVDVSNATVMVVEHAERFGLAQLHQLRGRIGRGSAKSFCILVTGPKVTAEAEQRLDTMVRTTDGFEIAEMDLQLRGPGEFFGTRQAGLPAFRVANLIRDRELLETARREAATLLDSKEISEPERSRAMVHLRSHWHRRYGLVEVG